MGGSNPGLPEQWVIRSKVVQAARNQPKHIYRWEREVLSAAGNMAQQREQGSVTFAEVPVPGKECCNEAEHSATLYVGNVRIDIYSSCGREQLKTLVEMLHIC